MIAITSIDAGLLRAARLLIALTFARGVYTKLRHYEEFIGVVAAYRLVPELLVRGTARAVLLLEGAAACCLMTGYALTWGAWLAVMLLCLFAVAIAINLARGRTEIDCGCFRNNLRQRIGPDLLVRNGVLAAIACLPAIADPTRESAVQLVNGVGGGLSLFVLCLIGEQYTLARRHSALLRTRWS
jgi:uncharacterized membrane protein YphA (DoxX/SURF4 family)